MADLKSKEIIAISIECKCKIIWASMYFPNYSSKHKAIIPTEMSHQEDRWSPLKKSVDSFFYHTY
jgi:hypothetical protein